MSWLLEDPTTVLLAGGLILVLLAVALFQTRQPMLLAAMAGVVLVVLLCLLIEWLVVTSREEVAGSLESMAALLEENRTAAALEYIDPLSPAERAAAEAAIKDFVFKEVSVTDMQITIHSTEPPTATVDLVAVASFNDRLQRVPYDRIVRRFNVQMRRDTERWVITNYQHRDFRE